jgi:hypothetical protein
VTPGLVIKKNLNQWAFIGSEELSSIYLIGGTLENGIKFSKNDREDGLTSPSIPFIE